MYSVGEQVKVKINGKWQLAIVLKSGRNKCYVATGSEIEYYADLDTLAGESRWVNTIDMKPCQQKKK